MIINWLHECNQEKAKLLSYAQNDNLLAYKQTLWNETKRDTTGTNSTF